ncbi:MAG: hypothetical protein ACTSX1_03425 [Candidatus Heimdallarchaeaceae archaeon]
MSENKKMMIIEGLKTLGIIKKKMERNTEAIQKYASQVSTERPYYETEDRQTKAVKALTQSNEDLRARYLDLKDQVNYTNLMVRVSIEGQMYSLSSLLIIEREIAKMMFSTYEALNDNSGRSRLRSTTFSSASGEKQPHVIRFFKEQDRIDGKDKWHNLLEHIKTRLEVINATTELIDLPTQS